MKFYFPAFLWAMIILILSAMPSEQLPKIDLASIDKIAHLGVYFILCLLLIWGYRKSTKDAIGFQVKFVILIACVIFGILMELMQYSFFPNRYFEYNDMIANAIGALIGILLTPLFSKFIK